MNKQEVKLAVLIAEDDDAAAHLIKTNLSRTRLDALYFRARNGSEALRLIAGENIGGQRLCDCKLVVLLDIRMPKMDGIQVLEKLKQTQKTCSIPVIMLTTSDRPVEVRKCYKLGCNFYIRKQVDYKCFVESIKALASFLRHGEVPVFGDIDHDH